MSSTDPQSPAPLSGDEHDAANETEARIRRAPKYARFMILGGAVGAVVTFILTASRPVDPLVGFSALFGYLALYGVTAGVVVGALVALLFDRIGLRGARPATVVTTPDEPEPQPQPEPEPQPEPRPDPADDATRDN